MSLIQCKFCNPVAEDFHILRPYLPEDYDYLVCRLDGDASHFRTRLRTSGKNQEYAHKWLDDFQKHSKVTMRVERTYPHCGTKNVFKIDLRCQHNTRPRSEKVREKESAKNTDCPAKMVITIKRVVTERKSRSKDEHLPEYPTVLQLDFCHNHAILTPEILRHRSVLPDVKEKILTLYKLGHNPTTALDMHKYDLLLEYGENFAKISHDRAVLPDPQYCYRLYYKIAKKHPNSPDGENPDVPDSPPSPSPVDKKLVPPLSSCENSALLNCAQKNSVNATQNQDPSLVNGKKQAKRKSKLDSSAINKKDFVNNLENVLCKFCEGGGFAGMQILDNNTVMALCTPLMNRVHKLIKQSGEMVFVDSYGDMEEANNCRIRLLVTYSSIGPVPLGCLVTTSDTVPCVSAAIDLWKQILPGDCFFNKPEGPGVFFIRDSEIERESFKSAFPKSNVLCCLSHLLQESWLFLWDRKNAIKKEHRSMLFSKIKMLLFSQTIQEIDMNYTFAMSDSLVKGYTTYIDYLTYIYNHKYEWSLVYRRNMIPRAGDVTFFWETAMVVLKDPILSRTRTYNPLQVIDFLSRLDTYYERKLIDLANSRFDSARLSRFLFIELPREAYTITQNSETEYDVHNDTKDTTYQIDITQGMCECRTGKFGAPCKHQLLVYRNFTVPCYDCIPPNTEEEKQLLLHLATGHEIKNDATIDTANKSVSSAVLDSCAADISIHDLGACNASDFFLHNNDSCATLAAGNTLGSAGVLDQHNPSLIPTTHILEQNPNTAINAQDVVLSQQALLDHLDPTSQQALVLRHHIGPHLSDHINQNNSSNPHLNEHINQNPPSNLPLGDLLTQNPPSNLHLSEHINQSATSNSSVSDHIHQNPPSNSQLSDHIPQNPPISSHLSDHIPQNPTNPHLSNHSPANPQPFNVEPPPPPTPQPTVCETPSDIQSTTELINRICSKLKEKTSSSPQVFKPALATFLKSLDNLSADSPLEYALYSFGKFSSCAPPYYKGKVFDSKLVSLQSVGEPKPKKLNLHSKASKKDS